MNSIQQVPPNISKPGHKRLGAVVGSSLAFFAAPVFAYLDPSTGSMVVSAIVGIFASIALAVKTYWYRLKRLFRGGSKPARGSAKEPSADQ